jgi:stage V sporulation protein AC
MNSTNAQYIRYDYVEVIMANVITKSEYQDYVNKKSPDSPIYKNLIWAFIVGGAICVIGQAFRSFFISKGFSVTTVSSLTSIVMIFLGVLLTGLNLYDDIGKRAGAGSIVPITGFANSIVSPAMEYKSEGFVLGVGAKMFLIAGPVLVYGISTSVIIGILYFLFKS